MKKNILLLINGFGIEQKDSYNVYSADLMPNLDRLTKEKMFVSLANNGLDYKTGYRSFSIGIDHSLSYNIVANNLSTDKYKNDQTTKYIVQQANLKESKLHIFCFWDNDLTIDQLMSYVSELLSGLKTRICLHIVFSQKSLNDYKNMIPIFTKLNYEFSSKLKIGLVTGIDNFSDSLKIKDVSKALIAGVGEKWKEVDKKLDVLIRAKTIPSSTRTFMLSDDSILGENDQILFFNYSNLDVKPLIDEIQNQKYKNINLSEVKYYSFFPVKSDIQIPYINNFAVSSTYALNSLKSIGAKCIILDKKEHCPYINYYFTGLRNTVDDDLKYFATDDDFIYDKEKLLEFIKQKDQELIIINYEIESCQKVDDIEDKLKKIDIIIGELDKYVNENNQALVISSLYGLEKELYNSKYVLCKINFSVRVPLIVDDNSISKASFNISEGNLYDLSNTIFKNINPKFKGKSLIKKKSSLLSIFYK